MKVEFLNLKRQYEALQEPIERAVVACLRSGAYIEGPAVKELEAKLAAYIGVKHVITCGNGTDALMLALKACGVGQGDEVVTTPFSFFATSEAISAVGARPVFADIRQADFNIDPDLIEAKITERTKAILPVHIFGQPADMDAIRAIAARHGLRVIEDAAQAIGAQYKGKKCGALSDAGCFSFYPTKNLGACGDAGMVTTDSDEVAVACRALKAHAGGKTGAEAYRILKGEAAALQEQADGGNALYDPYKYYNFLIGANSRLDSVQAAVLSVKLEQLDRFNAARSRIAQRYCAGLAGTPLQLPPLGSEETHSCWHQYAVLAPDKSAFSAYLSRREIGTGAFYPVPLHLQKAYAGQYRKGDCPVAESVCDHSVCLPMFPELREDEQDYVIRAISAFFGG